MFNIHLAIPIPKGNVPPFMILIVMCQTRHGEVRVWQLPEKAKILMDKRQEDGEGGENIDEPVHNQGNESDGSNEFLKEENDFKDKNISIEVINNEDTVKEDEQMQDRYNVEVLQGGRPLHHHPISTSVSGRCKKISREYFPSSAKVQCVVNIEIFLSNPLGPLHFDIGRWFGDNSAGDNEQKNIVQKILRIF